MRVLAHHQQIRSGQSRFESLFTMTTHTLSLIIEDDAFQRIKSEMGIKMLVGNTRGAPDELVSMIINSIENNEEELKIEARKK